MSARAPLKKLKGQIKGPRGFVTLKLNGVNFEFILDTGFDGELVLPEWRASQVKFRYVGQVSIQVVDGSVSTVEVAEGTVNWFGTDRRVRVLVPPSGSAVMGMGLIRETKLEFDYSNDLLELTYTGRHLFDPHHKEQ